MNECYYYSFTTMFVPLQNTWATQGQALPGQHWESATRAHLLTPWEGAIMWQNRSVHRGLFRPKIRPSRTQISSTTCMYIYQFHCCCNLMAPVYPLLAISLLPSSQWRADSSFYESTPQRGLLRKNRRQGPPFPCNFPHQLPGPILYQLLGPKLLNPASTT